MFLNYIPFFLIIASLFYLLSIRDTDTFLFSNAKRIKDVTNAQEKLHRINKTTQEEYENFRAAQLFYGILVFALVTPVIAILRLPIFIVFLLPILLSAFAFMIIENRLSRRVTDREKRLEREFPYVLEMLTLSIAAGDSPAVALDRFTKRGEGILAKEFKAVVDNLQAGQSLTQSLDDFSHRNQSRLIQRFVNSLIIAMNRGTPLFEILSAQAKEARNSERSLLIALAGKAELSMMIPIVFLILPISVIFALFPSLSSLSTFA